MLNFYTKQMQTDSNAKEFIKTAALAVEVMATENAELFGYGRDNIAAIGGFWIVSKIRFDIKAYPQKPTDIIAETWPLPPGKIKVERQYRLKDNNGNILLNAASEWCILSLGNRRPMRTQDEVLSCGKEYITEKSGAGDFTRVRPLSSDSDFCYERKIIETDIDANNHTNNKKYTEMVLDCFSDDYLSEHPIKTYELHFLKETRLGDVIKIYKGNDSGKTLITGLNGNEPVFNAVLEF